VNSKAKKTALLLSALLLLTVGIVYQNCGSVVPTNTETISVQHPGFLEKKYDGPVEISPPEKKEASAEDTKEEPWIDEKKAEDINQKAKPVDDSKVDATTRPTTGRRIDPCRMDTNGNGVIDKNDQKLLYQMMQGGLTPDQIAQFDYNNDGQVNQTEILYYPSHVGEICQKLKQIVVNEQSTCAISRTGKVYCWGSDQFGQSGNGTAPSQLLPMEIDVSLLGITNSFKEIGSGLNYYCGIHESGKIYCWGNNQEGVMGNGTINNEYATPVEIDMSSTGLPNDFKSLAVGLGIAWNGTEHVCAVHSTGQLFCWGDNEGGKLGTGNEVDSLTPIGVNSAQFSSSEIIAASAGHMHTCAIDSNHKLYCWGSNYWGTLGNGNTVDQFLPVEVDVSSLGLTNNFKKVSAGAAHTCAIHDNDKAYCWGVGSLGMLGNGSNTNQSLPNEVGFVQSGYANAIKDISAGIDGTCAIDMNNKGFCWGTNEWGALGIGIMGNIYNLPQPIEDQPPEYATFKQLSTAHGRHTCGIGTNGKAYCWVYATAGQLGNGTTILLSSHPMDLEVNVTNVQ